MVNATQRARPFGKRPAKWLELPSTTSFLNTLVNVRKSDISNFIITQRGKLTGGIWMHEDVALEFARWLSSEFAIWGNDCLFYMAVAFSSISMLANSFVAFPRNHSSSFSGVRITGIRFLELCISLMSSFAWVVTMV